MIHPAALILIALVVFFLGSYVFMLLWNGPLRNSLLPGVINKIDYPTAMGLVLFLNLFFGSSMALMKPSM